MSNRPEHLGPPEIFYNDSEAQKYTYNSRVIEIQTQMCERALELLMLPEDQKCFLLDIGCGSGLSGTVLEENGHCWVGMDISTSMLKVASDREVQGDLIVTDMGQGVPFKAASFDGAISISALQWICNIDKTSYTIQKRLNAFFQSLFACLSSGARAVFQFYPENDQQIGIITSAATRAGFFGGTIVDFPNSKKAKKFFLVLMTTGAIELPRALDGSQSHHLKRKPREGKGKDIPKCKRDWIMKKKERHRRLGKVVKADSKYSGRKRSKKN
ncbi:hypothetical protein TSAR_005837 [Trichomalopsis sarcophagae]|uniref:18S rRNA (guanine-N(7))-methyltransferase n=1 Tax=Trichomalopsis sarcophagae TaxID=543379 RepID=A0A232F0N2_9HYME|nr:hypothetical protein TSAR_005837 [Trichomalopsis sarcophagae]